METNNKNAQPRIHPDVHSTLPHLCSYHHSWNVSVPFRYYYRNPSDRFCKQCLEEGHIEVASIQLTHTPLEVPRLCYECKQCPRRTILALIPDFSFSLMSSFREDLNDTDFITPKAYWYHLPKRWPVICDHPLYSSPYSPR